ncbi:MAG: alpha-hydroxy acid oxidase [Pseudomonadota bacterium]
MSTSSHTSTPRSLRNVLSLNDFEAQARRKLPRPIYGYIAGAAENEMSLRANASAFEHLAFTTRVLRDVSKRSQSVQLFGARYSSPFGVAPMGIAGMTAHLGDLKLARAAARANIASVMSGFSLIPLERVAEAAPGTWFQAYLPGDTERIADLVARVARAGFTTLVLTVDIPVSANRENNVRTGFSTPLRPSLRLAWDTLLRPGWTMQTFMRTVVQQGMPHFENTFAYRGEPILSPNVLRDLSARDQLNWSHFRQIRKQWKGHLVIKGILSTADAIRAKDNGADGIILSNHGGRQLDGSTSPMRILAPVIDAVGDFPVMVDGGFRRGSDVLKALSIGARMVFIGRPFNYALAVAGEQGVAHAISLMREEIDRNMAMLGVNELAELSRDMLVEQSART